MSQTSTSAFHPAKTSSASRTDEAVATFAPHRSSTTVTNSRVSFESSIARTLTPAKFDDSEIFDARERAAFAESIEYKESVLTAGIGNFTLNVLFRRVVEIREADRPSDASLPHYLQEFAKIYEAQEKYEPAEDLYRRALKISEEQDQPKDFLIVRALSELAQFYKARERYVEAEEFSRRSLEIVEEKIRRHSAADISCWQRRPDDKILEATIKHARVPISEALDRLAEIYESQNKYAESEPLRRRSFEIKQQAWSESGYIWVDSLAAHANALHKIGREEEAAKLDEHVEAIRAKYPEGSVRSFITVTSTPMKRTLRGRFNVFINALLHSSPR